MKPLAAWSKAALNPSTEPPSNPDEQYAEAIPHDWKLYLRVQHDFALSLPESWVVLDPTRQDLEALLAIWNEELGAEMDDGVLQQSIEAGLPLLAVNVDPAAMSNGAAPTLGVGAQSTQGLTANLLGTILKAQIAANFSPRGEIELTSVAAPAGEGVHLAYTVGTGELAVRQDSFVFTDRKSAVLLTFSAPKSVADAKWYQRTVARIVSSVELFNREVAPAPDTSTSSAEVHRLTGTLYVEIKSEPWTSLNRGDTCSTPADSRAALFAEGASVRVISNAERVATGALGPGVVESASTCAFAWSVAEVPERDTYTIFIGMSGMGNYSLSELEQAGWAFEWVVEPDH